MPRRIRHTSRPGPYWKTPAFEVRPGIRLALGPAGVPSAAPPTGWMPPVLGAEPTGEPPIAGMRAVVGADGRAGVEAAGAVSACEVVAPIFCVEFVSALPMPPRLIPNSAAAATPVTETMASIVASDTASVRRGARRAGRLGAWERLNIRVREASSAVGRSSRIRRPRSSRSGGRLSSSKLVMAGSTNGREFFPAAAKLSWRRTSSRRDEGSLADVRDQDLERLFAEHSQRLYAFVTYRTGDPAVAEEIVGDTFERAVRTRRRFDRSKGSEQSWIYAIAVNLVTDHQRRAAVERRAMDSVGSAGRRAAASDPFDFVGDRDELQRALECLEPEVREVLALRYGADLRLKDIAKATGRPISTVHERLQRGLRQLQLELERGAAPVRVRRPARSRHD